MEPKIVERERITLVGLSFFGDPFREKGGWTEQNEIGRLWSRFMSIFAIIERFYNKAASAGIKTGMALAYQSAGEFLRFNPHWHAIVLEGGFDETGRFVHIPFGNLNRMSEYFRRVIIKFFLKKELISAKLATSLIN